MDPGKKQQLVSYLGMVMTMLGLLVLFYYRNIVSSLFLRNVISKDISYFLFKAQFVVSMLALLLLIIGIIYIFQKPDS